MKFGLQTKHARRVERALDAMVRAEVLNDVDLDHTALEALIGMHRRAEHLVARFESRDIDIWIGEQAEAEGE